MLLLQGTRSPPGSPWPLPQKWLRTEHTFTLNPEHFEFKTSDNGNECDIITDAFNRYRGYMFVDKYGSATTELDELESLYVDIENLECDVNLYPKLGDEESYTIEIPRDEKRARLTAKSVWGALRGLETFSQLVYQNETTRSYIINATRINDWPQYKYRGLLLDTSRHFQPMKVLLDNLVSFRSMHSKLTTTSSAWSFVDVHGVERLLSFHERMHAFFACTKLHHH